MTASGAGGPASPAPEPLTAPPSEPAPAPVLLDVEDGVALLRLNRPEASNAMDIGMLRALHEAIMRCHGDRRVRAVLLSGAGPNFCAGGDVRDFASKGDALPDYLRAATAYLQNAVLGLIRLDAPVVAAVQGWATGGGGFGLVCASDIVLAARSARLMLGATRVGMAPDAGASVTLQRIVGHRRALEIALTNPVIDAAAAFELGLVTRVVDDGALDSESLALARKLAGGPTKALGATKRLLWTGLGSSIEECLPDEARTVSELSGTEDAREGLAAVIERREPRYTGR
ncbi:MAG: enoyl-CoA hydratase/isomerase family protein [Acidimicrobiales bacterium]